MNLTEYREGRVYKEVSDIEGALPRAIFNVSPTKKVVFSKGNLQFQEDYSDAKNADGKLCHGTWRFAEHQWDVRLQKNEEVGIESSTSNWNEKREYWIDLFGWGTSGWSGGVQAYFPWATSVNRELYTHEKCKGAIGRYANADWGWFNPISNGGNAPNLWRTLTANEWCYLLNHARWTYARIEKVPCLLLLPKRFAEPYNIEVVEINGAFSPDNRGEGAYEIEKGNDEFNKCSCNVYDASQFSELENLGVVALPAGGCRYGRKFRTVGGGSYWTSTKDICLSYNYQDNDYSLEIVEDDGSVGQSVRLVQDIK